MVSKKEIKSEDAQEIAEYTKLIKENFNNYVKNLEFGVEDLSISAYNDIIYASCGLAYEAMIAKQGITTDIHLTDTGYLNGSELAESYGIRHFYVGKNSICIRFVGRRFTDEKKTDYYYSSDTVKITNKIISKAVRSKIAILIGENPDLYERCVAGYLDIGIFDVFAKVGAKILPLHERDFGTFKWDDWFGRYYVDEERNNKFYSGIVCNLGYYIKLSSFDIFEYKGLYPREILREQVLYSDYSVVPNVKDIMGVHYHFETDKVEYTLENLARIESLPKYDESIYDDCGSILVPQLRYNWVEFGNDSLRTLCSREEYQQKLSEIRDSFVNQLKKIHVKAVNAAKKQLKHESSVATHPYIRRSYYRPASGDYIFTINKDGIVIMLDQIFWEVNSVKGSYIEGCRPLSHYHSIDTILSQRSGRVIEGGYIHTMFDGYDINSTFEDPLVDRLKNIWLLATKIVCAGAFKPQVYFIEQRNVYSIRYIPNIDDLKIKEIVYNFGKALREENLIPHFCINNLRINQKDRDRADNFLIFDDYYEGYDDGYEISDLGLGTIVLSAFIESYVKSQAFSKSKKYLSKNMEEFFPFLHGLFKNYQRSFYIDAVFDMLQTFSAKVSGIQPVLYLTNAVSEKEDSNTKPKSKTAAKKLKVKDIDKDIQEAEISEKIDDIKDTNDLKDTTFDVQLAFRDFDAQKEISNNESVEENNIENALITFDEIKKNKKHQNKISTARQELYRLYDLLPTIFNSKTGNYTATLTLDELGEHIIGNMDTLKSNGFDIILPKEMKNMIAPSTSLSLGIKREWNVSSGFLGLEELLDFDWKIAIGKNKISKRDFDMLLAKAGKVVKFKDQYVYFSKDDAAKLKQKLRFKPQKLSGACLIATALTGKFDDQDVKVAKNIKNALANLFKEKEYPIPKEIDAKMRPYQERGFKWLVRNMESSIGSILADDMGLGKTLQLIAALTYLKKQGQLEENKALIVVPTAVIINWTREIEKFSKNLSFYMYYNSNDDIEEALNHDIILTTYGTLRTHISTLKKYAYRVVVLDEAQAIKNTGSQIYTAVKALEGKAMVAMTGTPVENRLTEYYAIVDFTNSGLLGSIGSFKQNIANPIERDRDEEKLEQLRTITSPFIMRRLKTDKNIISDLPDKSVTDQMCSLTPIQAALYENIVEDGLEKISMAKDKFSRGNNILTMIMRLKQICNAPEHFSVDDPHKGAKYSGKAEALFEILDEAEDSGNKCIIFTQFKVMGEILQKWIKTKTGFMPNFINGELNANKRAQFVDKFQNDPNEKCIILSLKAAGTGLNLTSASVVIHYDLWWNPAVEEQATDRAYRIGQKKNVQVFRLICADTFEEKINAMIQNKRELADLTVVTGEKWIGDLNDKQLADIFKLTEI